MPVDTDVLRRFHLALVEEVRRTRPEALRRPFTVAEIYQNIVPYRTHRDVIGVEMNGDYEDALMRLLAGEGGFLILESEAARKKIRKELDSPHPNTGLFREFAAVDVRLNPDAIPPEEDAAAPEAAPAPDETSGVFESSEEAPAPSPSGRTREAAPPETAEAWEREPAEFAGEAGRTCSWCGEELPGREDLRFCPWCGTDVRLQPCPECGEGVEPGWRFCVACGTDVRVA